MAMSNDDFLAVRGIAAQEGDDRASYLYVPGQLVVPEAHAEHVRADLGRRRLLGPGAPKPSTFRSRSFDVRVVTRLYGRVEAGVLKAVLRERGKVVADREPTREEALGEDPRSDASLREVGLVPLRLASEADVPSLVTEYRARGIDVAPNHVLHMEGYYEGNPGDLPVAAKELPLPKGTPGNGPRVVILDTGIQREWERDPWFSDRVDGAGADDLEVLDADRDGELDLQAGHGTFIASLVARHCPSATIIPRRVLNSFGLTSDVDLAHAILRAAKLEPDLLVLSLGAYCADDRPPPAIERALAHLPAKTVVVAAAGNAGQSRVFWPAALKTVVAVGSHDGGDPDSDGTVDGPERRAHFSNFGWWVDACADGLKAHAKFIEWDGGLGGLVGDEQEFSGWAVWSGTSFAAPIVVGALAQHMVDNGGDADDAVRARIRAPGRPQLADLGTVIA